MKTKIALVVASLLLIITILAFVSPLYIAVSVVDFGEANSAKVDKVHSYILQNYESEGDGLIDFWQHPLHTIIRGKGDCEDLALLEWILLKVSGVNASLVYGKLNNRGHLWVEYQGEIFESTGLSPSIPQLGEETRILIYQPLFHIGGD